MAALGAPRNCWIFDLVGVEATVSNGITTSCCAIVSMLVNVARDDVAEPVATDSLNGSGNFDSNSESKLFGSATAASVWLTLVIELLWLLLADEYCGVTATGACTGGKLAWN